MIPKQYTIDATGKALGRVASEVARILSGKDSPQYMPNVVAPVLVVVTNLLQARFTGTKITKKLYWRFSGYPGGLRSDTLGALWEKNPEAIFAKIVSGMLPKNKLRKAMLKHLKLRL